MRVGANIFDFLTSPVEGAGESPQTNEFMLFVKIWGGQVPIGWSAGAVATLDLYGTAWKLYEGKNEASGQTVRSMIPDTPFEEDFTGDLKLWLDAMVSRGYASGDEFVNVGNGGTEVFYGKSQMEAIVSLNINI
jgi:hypothetical protein